MKTHGSKDIIRIESIREKSGGDFMSQILHAYNMACAITEPGKALARGFAAKEVFGEHAAIAQIFFERAVDLGGIDVNPVASVNTLDPSKEGIEAEYRNIPIHEQPASRRPKQDQFNSNNSTSKVPWSSIIPLGKINTIKGSGPQFDLHDYFSGTIEVWQTAEGKYRLIYTSNYDPNFSIKTSRQFKFDGNVKEWILIDYIAAEYIFNLAPLYGKSIPIYCYN